MVFEALSGRIGLDSSSFRRGVDRAGSSAASFGATASSAFGRAGDSASEAGNEARLAGSGFESLGDKLRGVSLASTMASSRVDEAGDSAQNAGMQAAAGAGGAGLLTTALFGIGPAAALASTNVKGLTVSLVAFVGIAGTAAALLSPLAAAAALASGAILGLAAAFGAIIGSGLLAFNEQGKGLKKTLKDLQKQLKPLIVSFGKQFVPLIKDALNAIVPFTKAMLDALGNLTPFTDALRALGGAAFDIIPKMLELFVDVARTALPAMTQLGNFIASNLVPAFRALMKAGRKAAAPVARFAAALWDFGKTLQPLAGWLGKLGMAVYDFIGALGGIGSFTSALDRLSTVIQGGVRGAIQWLSSTGVSLAKQAFSLLSSAAMTAFAFGRDEIVPAIRNGLVAAWNWVTGPGISMAIGAIKTMVGGVIDTFRAAMTHGFDQVLYRIVGLFAKLFGRLTGMSSGKIAGLVAEWQIGFSKILGAVRSALTAAWNWVRGPGVQLAKTALKFLATQALAAFKFGKNNLLPKIQKAVRFAWNWVRTRGVALARQALTALGRLAVAGFKFGKQNLLPKIRTAIRTAWNWVKTRGVALAKGALQTLGRLAVQAFKFGKQNLLPKIRRGIKGVVSWVKNKGLSLFKGGIRSWSSGLVGTITTVITGLTNKIVSLFKTGIPKVRNWLRNNGTDVIRKGWEAIGKAIRLFILGIFAAGGLIYTAFVSGVKGLADWVRSGGLTKLKNAFINMLGGIVSYLKGPALGDLKGAAEFMFDGIMAAAEGLYKGLIGGSLIPDMFDDIASFIRNFDLLSAANSLLSSVWKRFHKFGKDALNTVQNFIGDIASWLKTDAKGDLVSAAKTAATAAADGLKNAFNNALPDKISIPSISVGGGKVAGVKIPKKTIGGQSLSVPKLAKGGEIKAAGLAMVHAGEEVVPAADVRSRDTSTTGTQQVDVTISVEGDSELADMIQRNIEANEAEKDRAIDRSRSSFGAGGG